MLSLTLPFLSSCGVREDSGNFDVAMEALENEDYNEALKRFNRSLELDDRAAECYRGLGIIYSKFGENKKAAECFEKSLDTLQYDDDKFSEDVTFYLADSYRKSGMVNEAIALYDELKGGLNPALAYALKGAIHLKTGDIDKAIESFDAAMNYEPDLQTFLVIYDAYEKTHLEGDGAEYLEKAIKIAPVTATDYMSKGQIYAYLGETGKAIDSLNKAIEGGISEGIPLLGYLYLTSGDIDSAKTMYTSALKKAGFKASAYNGLALCSLYEGNYSDALKYIKKGLACNDESMNRTLLSNEIVIYEKELDFKMALNKAKEFMKLYPDDEEIKKEIHFLERK